MSQKEGLIQKQIVRWLLMQHGTFAYSIYNGGTLSVRGHYKPNSFDRPPGFPDVLFIRNGVTYYLEVKTLQGRLSTNQRVMHQRMSGVGASVYVVRSLQDVIDIYHKLFTVSTDVGFQVSPCVTDESPDEEHDKEQDDNPDQA